MRHGMPGPRKPRDAGNSRPGVWAQASGRVTEALHFLGRYLSAAVAQAGPGEQDSGRCPADYGRGPAGSATPGIADAEPDGRGILILCTANMCRSPMTAALLSRRLAVLGVPVPVSSAGMLTEGTPPAAAVIEVMAGYGLDLGAHRSRIVTAADLAGASLVLGMAREHIRHAVVTLPAAWPRAFTLKEFVRRGGETGPRLAGEPFAAWLARVHAGRDRATLLGESAEDDVADPVGGPPAGYTATAALLDDLLARLTELCWAHAGPRT